MKCQRVQYTYIYIYICMCIHIVKQKGMEATGVKNGVQSQENVNIPVSFESMRVVRGIYVKKTM